MHGRFWRAGFVGSVRFELVQLRLARVAGAACSQLQMQMQLAATHRDTEGSITPVRVIASVQQIRESQPAAGSGAGSGLHARVRRYADQARRIEALYGNGRLPAQPGRRHIERGEGMCLS